MVATAKPQPKLSNFWTSFGDVGVVVVRAEGASYCPDIIYALNLPELVGVYADAISSTMEHDYPGGKVKAKYLNTFIPLQEARRLQAMSAAEFVVEFFENSEELLSLTEKHKKHISSLQTPGWYCATLLDRYTGAFKAMGHYQAGSLLEACLKIREYSDKVGATDKDEFYEVIPTKLVHLPKEKYQNRTIVGSELIAVMEQISAADENEVQWVTLQKGVKA